MWLCLFALIAASLAEPPAPATFVVAGMVVDHLSNHPLENMAVALAKAGLPADQIAVRSDANGRFAFNVPAGKYLLSVYGRDGSHQRYREDGQFSTGIAAGPGHDTANILFPFKQLGKISGVVRDEDGDPVPDAQVYLFRRGVSSGREQISEESSDASAADGAFHFNYLPPGTYFIAVAARPWYQNQASNDAALDVTYPITYYGNVQDYKLATPIRLTEGASANVQIVLTPVPAVSVSLPDEPDSPEQYGRPLMIMAQGPGGALLSPGIGIGASSHRSVSGIAPGRYTLDLNHARTQVDIDSSGNMHSVSGAQPGRYSLIAIDDGSELAYQEAGIIQPYLAGGIVVDLPLADKSDLKVPVQTRRGYSN